MFSWVGFAASRAKAAGGLFLTLLALVAATTGIIAGTVGYTSAAATSSAREAVSLDRGLEVRTRLAHDPAAQARLARQIIDDTFAPAPVEVEEASADGDVTFTVRPDAELLQPDDLPHYADGADRLRLELRATDVAVSGVFVEGDLAEAASVAARNIMVSRALGAIPLSVLVLVTVLAVMQVARLLANSREAQLSLLVARGASARQVFALSAAESTVAVVAGAGLGLGAALLALRAVPFGAAQWPTTLGAGLLCFAGTLAIVLGLLVVQVRAAVTPGFDADRSGRTSRAVTGATLAFTLLAAGIALWQLTRAGSPLMVDDDGGYSVNLVAGAAPALLLAAAGVVALGLLGPLGALVTASTRRARGAAAFLTAAQSSRRVTIYAAPVLLTVLATGAATTAAMYAGTSAQLRDDLTAVADGAPLRATLAGGDFDVDVPGVDAATPVWIVDAAQVGDASVPATGVLLAEIRDVVTAPEGMRLLPEAEPVDAVGDSIVVPPGTAELILTVDAGLTLGADDLASLDLQAEDIRHQLEEMDETGGEWVDEQLAFIVGDTAERLGRPMELDVRLQLRTLDTGDAEPVSAGPTTLPGPEVTYDEETLTGHGAQSHEVHAEHVIALDPGRRYVIDALRLINSSTSGWPRGVHASLQLTTGDGESLLADTGGWASTTATTPELAEALLGEGEQGPGDIRPVLDTSGPTWRLQAHDTDDSFWGSPISAANTPAGPSPTDAEGRGTGSGLTARVALTPAAADAAALGVGDTFELQFMNRRIPAELVGIVDAVPGRTEPLAALVDMASVGAVFASSGDAPRPPSELWASTSEDPATVAPRLAEALGGAEVRVGGQTSGTDPTAAARLIFWIACAGAVLLAVTGIAAASAAMRADRRPEVAVLRALGMTPRSQAWSRAMELAGVVVASVAFGLVAGWVVSRLVVPALAQATVAPGQVRILPELALDAAPWAGLMALGAVGVALVLVTIGRQVRAEALDDEYREEVR
ncbi:MAG: ABC transporter permease [Propionibacterium sp.]|nr:ABC transporter permease [Propionibacterium sp.]